MPGQTVPVRYSRQALFEGIGASGQARIMDSRAALIGCGGLGSVLAETLVRAGIGFMRIVDPDTVEASNLQRQTLFDTLDAGKNVFKAEAAGQKLMKINPGTAVEAVVGDFLDSIDEVIEGCNVILDGTDNYRTRYALNRAAVMRGIPWVFGAVAGSIGMSAAVIPGKTPCLHCLLGPEPDATDMPDSSIAGIIGPAVQMTASIQATETLRLICCSPAEIPCRMIHLDVWEHKYRVVDTAQSRDPDCVVCGGLTR